MHDIKQVYYVNIFMVYLNIIGICVRYLGIFGFNLIWKTSSKFCDNIYVIVWSTRKK